MARFKLASFLLVTATLMLVASGAQSGLLGTVLGTVTGAVTSTVNNTVGTVKSTVNTVATATTTTLNSLVTIVSGLQYDPHKIIIIMKDDNKAALAQAANDSTAMWTEAQRVQNIQNIVAALQQHAKDTQGPVIQLLSAVTGLLFTSNWIDNTIEVLDCPLDLVEKILELVGVAQIIYDIVFTIDPVQTVADSTSNTATAGWGATKIKAPNVWATNNTGKNVVVGTIDTGVLSTHETLVSNWIGPYGWYDPSQKTATPFDANGHGTHTLATIVGSKGVGIAPGAKWLTCKACGSSTCTLSLLTTCAQFMLCPTDTNGNNCDASKAPHLVSNSWGAGQGMTYFQSSLDAWSAARILPIFATGNSGANGCSSVVSPGDSSSAFAVGATDVNDTLGSFSSLGPSVNGLLKPDFTGPGVSIRSAWIGNNTDYTSLSGTSMAAPHLSGTIALALSARPGFCFSAMKSVLQSSMDRTLPTASMTCGGTASSTFPNNEYGYGRLNAQNVVSAALGY